MVDGDVVKIGPRAIPFTFRDERGHVHEWIAVAAYRYAWLAPQ
jgi:hypothetical protein